MTLKPTHKYDDIIGLPHHVSRVRPRMSAHDRAAQFSSFAALRGYDEAIDETARLTDEKPLLDADEIARLDASLQLLHPGSQVRLSHFRPDERKSGGAVVTTTATVKRLDPTAGAIILEDGAAMNIEDIMDIEII